MSAHTLYELIYASVLASGVPVTEIARIVRVSRSRNAELGITGLLVFDGVRLCQYLEGEEPVVHRLMARIAEDVRHVEVTVLHQGSHPGPRRFHDWQLGYALSPGGDGLGGLASRQGADALVGFLSALPEFDLEP